MKKSSKIVLTIFFLILIGLSSYVFFVFRERNAAVTVEDNRDSKNNLEASIEASTEDSGDNEEANNDFPAEEPNDDEETAPEDAIIEKNSFLEISASDCENKCKDFSNATDLKYCQQTCGISTTEEIEEDKNCERLKDLEKDYCLKDLAITKSEIEICKKIEDASIQKTCTNKIAQDLINIR